MQDVSSENAQYALYTMPLAINVSERENKERYYQARLLQRPLSGMFQYQSTMLSLSLYLWTVEEVHECKT